MVAIEHDERQGERSFVLRPDARPDGRQTIAIFALVALTCLLVGLVYALAGFWPIMAFAGLEVLLLGWALYYSAHRLGEREVIRIGAALVEVYKGRRVPQRLWRFQRSWTEVRLVPPAHRWHPSRLVLRSRGQEVTVGGFLLEDERVYVARQLERYIGPMAAPGTGV
jgi:uncharacterized membrane protein